MSNEAVIGTASPISLRSSTRVLSDHLWRLIVLSLAILLVWALGLSCVYSLREARDADAGAQHANNVSFEASRLVILLHDSETDQRGYLLTGKDEFLTAYNESLNLTPRSLAHLRELTANIPGQQDRVDRLEQLVAGYHASLERNIQIRQMGTSVSTDIDAIAGDKAMTDKMEELANALTAEENELYRAQSTLARRHALLATTALLIGLLVSTAAIFFMSYVMMREIARRRFAESELKGVNANLEQSVAARTADLKKEIEVRRASDAKLQDTGIFLDTVIQSLPGMLCIKDVRDNSRFILFNRAGEQLLGYDRSEYIGKTDYDFFPKEQADFFVARDREVMNSGKPLVIAEEPITTRHNGTRVLRTIKVPVLDKHNEPRYLLIY